MLLGAELIGSPIGNFLMMRDPWIPMLLGWGMITASSCIFYFIPETLHLAPQRPQTMESEINVDAGPTDLNVDSHYALRPSTLSSPKAILASLKEAVKHLEKISAFMFEDLRVPALLVTFIVHLLPRVMLSILIQYVSKRYDIPISRAGFLITLRSGVSLVLLTVILPGLSWYIITKLHSSGRMKDLWLARASVLFCVAGSFMMALAPAIGLLVLGLIVQTLGIGFPTLVRSLITTLVEPHHVGRLYTSIGVIDAIGALLAGPLLAGLFHWGLTLGGIWQGMPIFAVGIIYAGAACIVWMIRMPKATQEYVRAEGDE
jgi:hypothetical protein